MPVNERVVRLVARGDGVTEGGRFVAGSVPGDTVDEDGLIAPGPDHIAPICRHFGRCGGCQLQHVSDAAYASFITDRIAEALKAQGLAIPAIFPPHLSPPGARRRVAMRAMRQGKQVVLGFAEGGSHKLVDLAECPVMHEALFRLVRPLRSLLATLLPDRRAADIRMALADQGVDLLLKGVAIEGLAATEALTRFAEMHRLARASVDEGYGPSARWEPSPVTITLSGVAVQLPEGAFLQATADGEAALVTAVSGIVRGAGRIADLFAGLGTFSLATAAALAVEGARDAILSLKAAAPTMAAEHRDLFRRPMLAAELAGYDALILDPPRAGAKEQADELARSGVPVIAYVSCNPSTFARDARTLVDGGYRLEHIQPVGQFRWSTHVELAAAFRRGA
jgi:23S rRNA (uracil1939-C5)-methyltransferase